MLPKISDTHVKFFHGDTFAADTAFHLRIVFRLHIALQFLQHAGNTLPVFIFCDPVIQNRSCQSLRTSHTMQGISGIAFESG